MSADEGSKLASFGFKLGRSSAVKKLQPGVLSELKEDKKITDFITGVEGHEIQSDGKRENTSKDIVIPMLPNTLWKGSKVSSLLETSVKSKRKTGEVLSETKTDLELAAINELLEDAAKQNQDWEERGLEAPSTLTIPAMENKTASAVNEEEDKDDESEENQVEETDYEAVPISAFGMAMLRGMGWKEGEGIGKTKQVVDPIQAVARPKGLGLGADSSALAQKNKHNNPGRARDGDEELDLKKGSYCQVLKGPNEDMYGEIEGLDEDNARVLVKLAVGQKPVSLTQYAIRLVSKKEYDKFSKYINNTKAEKYKQDELSKVSKRRLSEEVTSNSSDNKHRRHNTGDRSTDEKSDRHKSSSANSASHHRSHKKEKKLWLRPQIRVRIVDKKYSKGQYYKEKVEIVDVLDKWSCSCRTEDGRLLDGLSQSALETVIPRSSPYVAIVSGSYAGQLGEILEKHKEQSCAVVQLLSDRDTVIELKYDDICEYTGDVHAELDY